MTPGCLGWMLVSAGTDGVRWEQNIAEQNAGKRGVFPTGNAGYVHDGRRVAGSDVATFTEQREEGGAHEELRRDVGLEGLLPVRVLASHQVLGDGLGGGEVGFRVRGVLCVVVACDPGLRSGLSGGRISRQEGLLYIVYKKMDPLWFLLGHFRHETSHFLLFCDVS